VSPTDGSARRRPQAPTGLRLLVGVVLVSAYFTGTKFLPELRNNFGPFEVVGALLCVVLGYLVLAQRLRLQFHWVVASVLSLDGIVILSLVKLPTRQVGWGVTQALIMIFVSAVFIGLYSFACVGIECFEGLIKVAAFTGVVVGAWLVSGEALGYEAINASGPFRNRAHMGLYMLTVFWLVLFCISWPGTKRLARIALSVGTPFVIYGVAVSGRRSVYFSLMVGLVVLFVGVVAAGRRNRAPLAVAGALSISLLVIFYNYGEALSPRAGFFRERLGMVDERVRMATTTDDEEGTEVNFYVLQRNAVLRALGDNPVLGLGWGAFAESGYSPTMHEVHSTPLRFLAEAGAVGFALYLGFVALILATAFRSMVLSWHTPFRMAGVVACAGFWSLPLSWSYNRHIHERTFWIFLAILLAFEFVVRRWRATYLPSVPQVQPEGKPSYLQGLGLAPGRERQGPCPGDLAAVGLPNHHDEPGRSATRGGEGGSHF
jgi:hypothetical protein